MGELTTWLRERLDHRQRVAQAAIDQGGIGRAGEAHWSRVYSDDRTLIGDLAGNVVLQGIRETWEPSRYQADHIALNDPAAVLADVAAMRAILDLHHERMPGECDACNERQYGEPCPTVRALGLAFAGDPGYREEWRPQ